MGNAERAAWAAAMVVAFAWIGGCGWLASLQQPPPPSIYDGFSPEARGFLEAWADAGDDEAQQQALLDRSRWPHHGPQEGHLREAAVAEAVRRGEAIFMGARTVVFENAEITPALREAVLAVRAEAELKSGPGADYAQDRGAVRVRIESVEHFAGGEVAVVRFSLRRGRPWEYEAEVLCAWRGGRWEVWHGTGV